MEDARKNDKSRSSFTSQETRSVLERKPSDVSDRKTNDRFRNRSRKPRDGKTGRHTAHETDAHDADEDPNSEEVESCEDESDLMAAFGGGPARTFRVHV